MRTLGAVWSPFPKHSVQCLNTDTSVQNFKKCVWLTYCVLSCLKIVAPKTMFEQHVLKSSQSRF